MIPEAKFSEWLVGFVKSKTFWLGAAITTMPDWLPIVQDKLIDVAGNRVVQILGILVVVIRAVTVRSIPQKGGQIVERKEFTNEQ